jgi:hypothetical protein
MKTLLLSVLLFSVPSFAADEPAPAGGEAPAEVDTRPHFLVSGLGVFIHLDEGNWKQLHWGERSFEVEMVKGKSSVRLTAHSTPFQAPIDEDDKAGWDSTWRMYAQTRGGIDAELKSSELVDYKGQTAYRAEVAMKTPGEEPEDLTLYGFSVPVKGQVLHLSIASLTKNSDLMRAEFDKALAALEIQAPADEPTWGGAVSGEAGSTTVSSYWRLPLEDEQEATENVAQKFQLGYIKDCWKVIHPTGVKSADVMVSCQQSDHQVGILDEYTYADVAPVVSDTVLRGLDLGEAERLDVNGKTAFYWSGKVKSDTFYVAAIPNAEGIATIWARGGEDSQIGDSVREAALAGTYTDLPEVEFREQALYYIKYRPTHPYVIGPAVAALLILLLILGIIFYGAATQKSYDDEWT